MSQQQLLLPTKQLFPFGICDVFSTFQSFPSASAEPSVDPLTHDYLNWFAETPQDPGIFSRNFGKHDSRRVVAEFQVQDRLRNN